MFLMARNDYFPADALPLLREKLLSADDELASAMWSMDIIRPDVSLTLSLLFGFVGLSGIDRVYIGQIGLGVLKFLTLGGLGIWTIIDWFMIRDAVRRRNYDNLMKLLQLN